MQDMIVVPDGKKWEFDTEVTKAFNEMLERSIPDYDNMRKLVYDIGKNFITYGSQIVDVGCSNGLSIKPFVDTFGDKCKYHLFDISDPMLDECTMTYEALIKRNVVNVKKHDLKEGIPDGIYKLVLSILTL